MGCEPSTETNKHQFLCSQQHLAQSPALLAFGKHTRILNESQKDTIMASEILKGTRVNTTALFSSPELLL